MGPEACVTVSAPTRLHFGLLSAVPPFGGLGAALETPRVEVTMAPAKQMVVSGSLAERTKKFLIQMRIETPLAIQANGPEEHTGLGVGTALGLSLAKAYLSLMNADGDPAMLSGRGERSRVGLAGFNHGGFIYDPGHGQRPRYYQLPAHWRFALKRIESDRWHGDRERSVFELQRVHSELTKHLIELIEDRILPAIHRANFVAFAEALGEYNRSAGAHFRSVQGGVYASPAIESVIADLTSKGIAGAGQSSWGPTVFVPVDSDEKIQRLIGWDVLNVARTGATTGN